MPSDLLHHERNQNERRVENPNAHGSRLIRQGRARHVRVANLHDDESDSKRNDSRYSLETPLPLNSTGCAPPPSCCTLTDAVRKPVAVGLNLTSMAQLELAGTLEPQVVVSTKSPKLFPTIPMPRMLNGVLPMLVNLTVCGGLMVPTL